MVSGLVTSPEDQSRICLDDARPIRIASNSLMSIKALLTPLPRRRPARLRADRLGPLLLLSRLPLERPRRLRDRPAARRPAGSAHRSRRCAPCPLRPPRPSAAARLGDLADVRSEEHTSELQSLAYL